nr:MAG TPA: hypothetical protein [Caudoviricetes sp.]
MYRHPNSVRIQEHVIITLSPNVYKLNCSIPKYRNVREVRSMQQLVWYTYY